MACDNADFDISKYMIYIRDTDISEQEAQNILQDILDEVSFDTKIFRDLFVFDIGNCDNVYDTKALYDLSQSLKEEVTGVTSTDYTTEQLINILEGKEFSDSNNNANNCSTGESQDSDTEDTNNSLCLNTYLNIIDLMWYDKTDSKQPIKSIISTWFQQVGNDIYELIPTKVSNDTGIPESNININNPIPVIGYVSIIPNIFKLTSDDERILRQVLIAGLKYKVSDMYLNTANEQVSNLLYQRYYNAKKQLAFNFPQFVSNQRVKNEAWNI